MFLFLCILFHIEKHKHTQSRVLHSITHEGNLVGIHERDGNCRPAGIYRNIDTYVYILLSSYTAIVIILDGSLEL